MIKWCLKVTTIREWKKYRYFNLSKSRKLIDSNYIFVCTYISSIRLIIVHFLRTIYIHILSNLRAFDCVNSIDYALENNWHIRVKDTTCEICKLLEMFFWIKLWEKSTNELNTQVGQLNAASIVKPNYPSI